MIVKYKNFILNEEQDGSGSGDIAGGVAFATADNTGGMGAIVAPQPSSIPGDVAGSTKGSGDLPAYDLGKSFGFPNRKRKRRGKKNGSGVKYITKFSNWMYTKY